MSIVKSFVKWLYHGDNNNMGPVLWATLARFETHQGSLCPPSKCREARTGLDAVILLSQEKVVPDDALISRPEKKFVIVDIDGSDLTVEIRGTGQ